MNEQEFEEQLNALHDRVLSKALSDEEKNNYTESLFESIRHVMNTGKNFGMLEIYKSLWNILNGETFAKLLIRQKKPAEVVIMRCLTILLTSTKS